jgi:hypothetical protein
MGFDDRCGNAALEGSLRRAVTWLGALLTSGVVALAMPALAQRNGQPWDPLEGMDANGRIERPELPPDLPNPERWRYIPEGRIKPGNIFQRLLVTSFPVPLVFIESDVGFGGGVALTDIDFRQQRRREFAGIFLTATSKGQQSYRMAWRRWLHHMDLPQGGVLQEERSFVRARGGYSKTLTRRFFGIGPDTREDDESSYTDELTAFGLGLERAVPRPGDDWIASAGARFELHNLSSGEVSGVPSTGEAFPLAFADAEDANLGWVEVGLRYDTRDSQRNPYRGWAIGGEAEGAVVQRGGDAGGRFALSGTKVFRLPGLFHDGGDPEEENPPTDVLALALWTQATAGELPFFSLPTLGGSDRLRGYIAGRWRDRAAWHAAAEYRFWFLERGFRLTRQIHLERLGAALFYEIGSVANDWPRLFEARVHQSYGVSLRLSLERAAPFRIDFGFSDEGLNINARFGLSF